MAALPSTGDLYTQAASGLDQYINPDALVNMIQSAVNVYMPAAYALAFVLLTVGTMREFLYPEMRRFFGTLLRTLLLVACMSGAPTLVGWLKGAADALAQMPSGVSFSINGTSYSLTGGQAPGLTQLENALQSKMQVGSAPPNSPSSRGSSGWLAPAVNAVKGFLSNAEHIAWEVLFAIFLLWLLLCKVVIILMLFIQKVVVIGFSLYTPIAIGECAHRSLKSKAVSFFLTFVGVLAWPVGWSLVNAVTMGILKSVPTPGDQNFVTLLVAIVAAIPVFLWILIGYVVAPIYAQKVVTRGGAAIQGFVGTMISVVGQSSAAVVAGALGAPAAGLGLGRSIGGGGEQTGKSSGTKPGPRPEKIFCEAAGGSDYGSGGSVDDSPAPAARRRGPGGLLGIGAGAIGAGAAVTKPVAAVMAAAAPIAQRFGSAAQFIGHGAAEGAGETSGMEYRAIRLIDDGGRRRVRSPGYQGNRSSFQARGYIDTGDRR
jgi:hypothetical protein